MTPEEYKKHIAEINKFLEDQDYISELYKIKGLETKKVSTEFLGDNLLQPLLLCTSTILYMVFAGADRDATKKKSQIQRMRLITAFLQGIDISTSLILEGNYIKATATLKQDYEIMIRMNAITKQKDKHGKTPNPQDGPPSLKHVYGYLNDIAHISKDNILNVILFYETKDGETGVSPVKKMSEALVHRLFTYDAIVKVEVLRQALILHSEMFGEDEIYQKAIAHYRTIIDIYSKEGMLGYHDESNGG